MSSDALHLPRNAAFFVTGGTLPREAPSYITRQADTTLLNALLAGEFCYVLTARQMGKSSLMVRTAERLRQQGIAVAVLDLTAIGLNLTPEQWYDGLLSLVGKQLRMEDELEDFWFAHERLAPMVRFFRALREVVLERVTSHVVLFVDEVDAVRSLSFSADEFFAGIREVYNRRVDDPAMNRLTFGLFGVAAPSDLIRDARVTPFNIGRRIELRDFTPEEAAPLGVGCWALGVGEKEAQRLIERVLYWTGGHPYLTQRLCRALVEAQTAEGGKERKEEGEQNQSPNHPTTQLPNTQHPTPNDVDRLCEELFLSRSARETEDNLKFVGDRLLRSEVDIHSLLDLYGKVWRGERVTDDETDPLVTVLKLAGIVRSEGGALTVRNRIYGQVFDRAWIEAQTEPAELRRQKEAYRRGARRTTAIAGAVLTLVMGFAVYASYEARRADANAKKADAKAFEALQNSVAANTAKAEAVIAKGDALLQASKEREATARANTTAKRNAELAALREKALQAAQKATNAERNARHAEGAAKQDALHKADLARNEADRANRFLYIANMNLIQSDWEANNVKRVTDLLEQTRNYKARGFEWGYWNRLCHLDLLTIKGQPWQQFSFVALSPDGKQIVTGQYDNTAKMWDAKVWDAQTGKELLTLKPHTKENVWGQSACFSADGARIIIGAYGVAKVWDARTGRELLTLKMEAQGDTAVAISADGKRILTGSGNGTVRVWDAVTGKEQFTFSVGSWPNAHFAFSADGKRFFTGDLGGTAKVWDVETGKERGTLTGGYPIWEPKTGNTLKPIGIMCAVLSPDGKRIVTGHQDGTTRVWDAETGREQFVLKGRNSEILSVCFSSDGKQIATGNEEGTAKIWDAETESELLTLKGHTTALFAVALSADGKRIVTGSGDGTVKVWDAETDKTSLLLQKEGSLTSVAFSSNGKRMVTGTHGGAVKIWDTETDKERLTLKDINKKGQYSQDLSVAVSADGKRIVTAALHYNAPGSKPPPGEAKVWDGVTGREILTLKHGGYMPHVAISADSKRIVTVNSGAAKVWDTETGRELLTLKGAYTSAAFSADGKRIVTGTNFMEAEVWDAGTGKGLLLLRDGPGGNVIRYNIVCFSPDGKRAVAGCTDGSTRVWDAVTGKKLLVLKGHTQPVNSVCFSADGKRIITGSQDGTARVWDAEIGRELLTLKVGEPRYLTSVAISPDGKRLVTGSDTARVWMADFDRR